MNKSTISLLGGFCLLIVGALLVWYFLAIQNKAQPIDPTPTITVTNFEECVAAKYPVQESYPPRCTGPDGRTFTQDIGNELSKTNLIKIDMPRPVSKISSPLIVTGEARGTWYFEASFPVELQDANGNVLAQMPAQAQGEWMTENFVPYKVTLTFAPQPAGSKGKLILHKDNPSGEPSRDDSLIVPVVF